MSLVNQIKGNRIYFGFATATLVDYPFIQIKNNILYEKNNYTFMGCVRNLIFP